MTQGLHQAFAVLPKVEITDILEPTVPFQLLKWCLDQTYIAKYLKYLLNLKISELPPLIFAKSTKLLVKFVLY